MRRGFAVCGLALITILAGATQSAASSGYGLWNWYVIPAAANLSGKLGTYWRTDLSIVNPYQYRSIDVSVMLMKDGVDGTYGPSRTFMLAAGQQIVLDDVVGKQFGFQGKGALVVWSDTGAYFTVAARTYTGSTSTYGQAINGQSIVNRGNGQAFVGGVRNDARFRTNIGVVNASSMSIAVRAEVFDAVGHVVGSTVLNILPWSSSQVSVDPFLGSLSAGYVRFYCLTVGDGIQWVAYASVADNVSGDGVHLEERPDNQYTSLRPSLDISGWWAGSLTSPVGAESVEAYFFQDGASISGYLFNTYTGCMEAEVWGSESYGTVRFDGYSWFLDYVGEDLWGTANATNSSMSGTFAGTGVYAGGGSFALSRTTYAGNADASAMSPGLEIRRDLVPARGQYVPPGQP